MAKTIHSKTTFIHIIFSAILGIVALTANATDVNVKFITMKDGLNNNTVRNITQDSKGFIWMASHNGLARYDGIHFVNIVPDTKASQTITDKNAKVTLADRKVNGIVEDNNEHLWVTTAQNLISCYDLKTEKFVDFTGCGEFNAHYKKMDFIDNDVWLWGSEGCRRVAFSNGKFASQVLPIANGNKQGNVVKQVAKTPVGVMVATQGGVYLWNSGNTTKISDNPYVMWIAAIGNTTLMAANDGTIWRYDKRMVQIGKIDGIKSSYDIPGCLTLNDRLIVFTAQGGYSINPINNKIERASGDLDIKNGLVTTDNNGDYWVYNGTGLVRYIEKQSGKVKTFTLMDGETLKNTDTERYHAVNDGQGKLWITTYGCGLYIYDKTQDKLSHYTADNTQSALIATNSLLSILQDKTGNIWIGTWLAGVSLLHPTDSRAYVKNNTGKTILPNGTIRMVDKVGNEIWIADTKGQTFKDNDRLSQTQRVDCDGVNIYAVSRDRQGTLWLGSRKYGLKIGNEWYRNNPDDNTSLTHNSVFDIHCDKRGRMWIGTFGGGLCLAVNGVDGKYRFKNFFNDNYGTRRVRSISEDKQGWLWIGTSGGLIVANPDKLAANPKAYHLYSNENGKLRNNEVRSIMRDSKGRMWIAETGEGFSVCVPGNDYANLSFKRYSTTDGLVNGMVQAFAEDNKGRVWISTEYGMSCFSEQTSSFRNFFFASTIAGNGYSENCAIRLADGRLAFGTNDGLAIIDPSHIAESKEAARVTFTELRINGSKIDKDNEGDNDGHGLPYAKEITLEHNQNSIEIYFSTLDFTVTSQTQYSYKLDGYDNDWSDPSSLNFAAYKNLEPGTYTLHVRATNADGVWSDNESSIIITIEPPLWATPWAYLLYALLVAAVVYIVVKTLKKMDALRMQVKVEEKMADYKLIFFTNISHEFRTPLTLIGASLDRMKRSLDDAKERKSALAMMDKSVARMGRLINELLEFHKAEKGALTLAVEPTDVIALLRNFYEAFADFAVAKQMDYRFEPKVDYLNIPIDRDKLDKIVYNLLSNAFKYTNSGGTIVLAVNHDKENEKLVISVTDNGVGVKPEERGKLFDRFSVGNIKRGSMGIGLHLVNSLVEKHKGTIAYSENPNGGSIFTVTLPATDKGYSEDEYLKTSSPSPSLPQGEGAASAVALSKENAGASAAPSPLERDGERLDGLEGLDDAPSLPPLNDRKILVIEDDNDVRQILVEELSPYVTVVARPDGESGYDYARQNDVDLILCDVMMPGMDGFEVTSRLKGSFDTSHIPVILLTALSAEESKLRGAQCGADNYLTKPFSTKLLLTRVLKTIEQRDKLKEKFSKDVTAVRPLISTSEKDKAFIDKLTEVINANLSNPDFTIDDFADSMALGRTILFRKIKGVTGYSPKEYLRVMRMKKAAELLMQPDMNVSEVAYAVGLSDPFYFSKCFKQQFGMPPSEYKATSSR